MKRIFALIVTLSLVLVCFAGHCDTGSSTLSVPGLSDLKLSPDNQCAIRPMIYCNPRWRNLETMKAYDLPNGLQAAQINQNNPNREYGLYFKFTPSAGDDGYLITRFDITISDRDGRLLYTDGGQDFMICQKGYYWAWDFISLKGFFDTIRDSNGKVGTGIFTLDVYFNSQWAGQTRFSIK